MSEEADRLEVLQDKYNERGWLMGAVAFVDALNIANTVGAKLPDHGLRQLICAK